MEARQNVRLHLFQYIHLTNSTFSLDMQTTSGIPGGHVGGGEKKDLGGARAAPGCHGEQPGADQAPTAAPPGGEDGHEEEQADGKTGKETRTGDKGRQSLKETVVQSNLLQQPRIYKDHLSIKTTCL